MLKKIRIFLALVSIVAVTLLFIDFTGTARQLWPWMAKIQFMPAVLSANIVALVILLLLSLVFGRVYCSVICPLGILQDIPNWIRGHVGSKKKRINRFRFAPAKTKTRLGVLTAFVILIILGLTTVLASFIAGLIEPYSAYGRIASQIIAPVYDFANNLLAGMSESRVDDYTFNRVGYAVSVPLLAVAIVTLIVVVVMAWRGGRDYCNTICPVGTILGYLSQFSLLKPVINTDKCINCGKCARNCKAKCIDAKNHAIDYTRCIECMDCISVCTEGAISYTCHKSKKAEMAQPQVDKSRRGFVTASSLLIGSVAMDAIAKNDGGLTAIKPKKPHQRKTKVLPAGAIGHKHVDQHCTGCQLCIQSCPRHVLKPNLDINGFMQPVLDFTDDYCHTDCTVCSDVCPVGAFHPVTEVEKSSIKVGTAVVDLAACISASEGENCGSCATHCPLQVIEMVETEPGSNRLMPVVDTESCIGCGSCEYHCPVGTLPSMKSASSAIHVEGLEVHRQV